MRLAASRTFCTAGRRSEMSTAMIAITTSSSIRVKPDRRDKRLIPFLLKRNNETKRPVACMLLPGGREQMRQGANSFPRFESGGRGAALVEPAVQLSGERTSTSL